MPGMATSYCEVCGKDLGMPDAFRHAELMDCVKELKQQHATLVEAARAVLGSAELTRCESSWREVQQHTLDALRAALPDSESKEAN